MDDEGALPHSVNVRNLNHCKGVETPVISNRKSIDILIGQTNKLLYVLTTWRVLFKMSLIWLLHDLDQ